MQDETLNQQAGDTVTPAYITCPKCKTPVAAGTKFCQGCGFPVGGTEWEQNEFDFAYDTRHYQLEQAQLKSKSGTTTLYWLAVLVGVGNTVLYFINDDMSILITGLVLAAIFFGLALWSKTNAFTALVVALILYATLLIADGFFEPETLIRGIIIKIIIIGALIKAIKAAREAQNITKELEIRNWIK